VSNGGLLIGAVNKNHRGRHRYPELPVLAAKSFARRSV